jgi:hypothetical protein
VSLARSLGTRNGARGRKGLVPAGRGGGGGCRAAQIGERGGARGERGPTGEEGKWAGPERK